MRKETSCKHLTQLLLIDYTITVGRSHINTGLFLTFSKGKVSDAGLCNDAKVLWLIIRVLLRYGKLLLAHCCAFAMVIKII